MPYIPLTQDQFQKARTAGFSPQQIIQNEQKRKADILSKEQTQIAQPKQGVFQKTDEAINKPAFDVSQERSPVKGVFKSIANSAKDLGTNIYNIAKAPVMAAKNIFYDIPKSVFGKQDMGATAGTIGDKPVPSTIPSNAKTLFNAIPQLAKSGAEAILPPALKELSGIGNKTGKPEPTNALESVAEKPFTNLLPLFLAGKEGIQENAPNVDTAISKVGNAPMEAVKTTAEVASNLTKKVTEPVIKSYEGTGLPEKTPEQKIAIADKSIETGISKGVKPTVVGKQTLANSAKFYDSAKSAVKTIAENRSKLQIANGEGEVVNKPSTNAEFAQAIDQTKINLYKDYNSMTRAATGKDAAVPTGSTITKLQSISQDLKNTPVVRRYAESKIPEIQELNAQSPEVIEARIAEYNKSLQNYYRNPTAESQVRAQVDASMAAELRRLLDETIETTEGPGYQELKNKYGDLKAIEGEVNKRATVLARQNIKGLPDLTDIFTGGKLIGGVLTGNIAAVAEGGFGYALKSLYKKLNSPDRAISKMFDDVYEAYPEPAPTIPFQQPALPAGDTSGGVFGKSSVNVPIPMPTKIRPLETGGAGARSNIFRPNYTPGGGKVTQIFGEPKE